MNHGDSSDYASVFDYSVLDTVTRLRVQQSTNEIKALMRRSSKDIVDIGQRLLEIKQCIGHGSFLKWIKSEFNWSLSAATKFMQVGEQFKSVNFTNLNITASALYLIAAPSTCQPARAKVLELASSGQNITYTKAKELISQYKKNLKFSLNESPTIDHVSMQVVECKDRKFVESAQHEVNVIPCTSEVLTEQEAEVKACSISSRSLLSSLEFDDYQVATLIKRDGDMLDGITKKLISKSITHLPINITNQEAVAFSRIPDTDNTEVVINLKDLTPEQLSSFILESVNNGLSKQHLEAIIKAAQQALYNLSESGVN
jgi:hypothetical protein